MVIKFSSGTSDFAELSTTPSAYLVDKSLFIRELFLELDKVVLLPRPRRFGKTLNMSMLCNFLSNPDSRPWFEKLKINNYPDIMAHLGQHPTIFLSFKDAKQKTYPDMLAYLAEVMSETYGKFRHLLNDLEPDQKNYFHKILEGKAEPSALNRSLFKLTHWLKEATGKLVWVVLDEYDAPIHSGWQYDYYSDIVSFMQSYLGAAFKDNSYLYRGVMTGILRVSRENIFSGLNNVSVYSMLSPKYGEYFGFTDPEIDLICELGEFQQERENIRTWYNGYQIGEIQLYNPWSIVSYAIDRALKPYWVNTSNNMIVKKLIAQSGWRIKKAFEQLMLGENVLVTIDEHAVLPGVDGAGAEVIWSFLLFSGYLKVLSCELGEGTYFNVRVAIPNEEIRRLYQSQLSHLFPSTYSAETYLDMLQAFTHGEVARFSNYLKAYLASSMSYFDAGAEEPERFYHGFVLGILVALKETHWVRSNRESGGGRYDVLVIPKDKNNLGIILEFKVADSESEQDMSQAIQKALAQIEKLNYEAELKDLGINNILKLAIVFHKKQMILKAV